jgi:nitroimidazol reductase NimA-like FMN-containing flavoprotein (pyridoxamine 5'-phosphate oxidase superfamily)
MSVIRPSSAWGRAQIEAFLGECVIPVRLAVLNSESLPLVCSLWYLYDEGCLWCATQRTASVVKLLAREPFCGFEIAPDSMPYRGVRGQGRVTLDDATGSRTLTRLIDRYLGTRESGFAQWLMARSNAEVAIRVEPEWMTSWDFSQRMSDA